MITVNFKDMDCFDEMRSLAIRTNGGFFPCTLEGIARISPRHPVTKEFGKAFGVGEDTAPLVYNLSKVPTPTTYAGEGNPFELVLMDPGEEM